MILISEFSLSGAGAGAAASCDARCAATMDLERTARRVYGNSHPTTIGIGEYLETSQAVLRARYKSRYWDILACSFAVALFAWVWWYLTNE